MTVAPQSAKSPLVREIATYMRGSVFNVHGFRGVHYPNPGKSNSSHIAVCSFGNVMQSRRWDVFSPNFQVSSCVRFLGSVPKADRPDGVGRPICFGARTTTTTPIFTRLYRSITSSLVIRIQPDEIALPIYS